MQDTTTTGFWSQHPPELYESELPSFIREAEFVELAENRVHVQIVEVRGPLQTKPEIEPQYVVHFRTADSAVRAKGFNVGKEDGPSHRDRMLSDMGAWLEEHPGSVVPVRFVLWGRMHGIEPDLDSAQDRDGVSF
jgi:hypothetical protein